MLPLPLANHRRPQPWPKSLAVALVLALTCFGQQTAATIAPPPSAPEDYQVPADWHDLLRLDEPMRRFFAARVPRLGGSTAQLDAIVAAILDRDGLAFTYCEEGNFDARETFRRRQGNCVAFSILVVAVAREYRLTARFNEVRIEPQWDRVGQLVAEFRHLNVLVRTDTGNVMVDLLPAPGPGVALASTRPISDARAFAMFYSNAGVALLGRGRTDEALLLLVQATAIAPEYAIGWTNLGHAYSISGDTERARTSYERALHEDPHDLKALASLAQLYRQIGQVGQAQELERKTERFRERNPYYLAAVARRDLATGNPATAEQRLRRALAIKSDEPDFYELAIIAAERLGHQQERARLAERLANLRARSNPPPPASGDPVQPGPAPVGP